MKRFATIVNGFQALSVVAKLSIVEFCGPSSASEDLWVAPSNSLHLPKVQENTKQEKLRIQMYFTQCFLWERVLIMHSPLSLMTFLFSMTLFASCISLSSCNSLFDRLCNISATKCNKIQTTRKPSSIYIFMPVHRCFPYEHELT